jgi:hypothetical protein
VAHVGKTVVTLIVIKDFVVVAEVGDEEIDFAIILVVARGNAPETETLPPVNRSISGMLGSLVISCGDREEPKSADQGSTDTVAALVCATRVGMTLHSARFNITTKIAPNIHFRLEKPFCGAVST